MKDLDILHRFFRIKGKNDLYYCFGTKGNHRTQKVEEVQAVEAKNIRTLPDWDNKKKQVSFVGFYILYIIGKIKLNGQKRTKTDKTRQNPTSIFAHVLVLQQ